MYIYIYIYIYCICIISLSLYIYIYIHIYVFPECVVLPDKQTVSQATSIDMQALKYQTTMLAENLQRLEMLFLASHGQSVKRPKSSSLDPWYDFDMSI